MKVEMEMTGTWYFTEGRVTKPYRKGKRYKVEEHVFDKAVLAGKTDPIEGRFHPTPFDSVPGSADEPKIITQESAGAAFEDTPCRYPWPASTEGE